MQPLTPDQEECMRLYGRSFWQRENVEKIIEYMREHSTPSGVVEYKEDRIVINGMVWRPTNERAAS